MKKFTLKHIETLTRAGTNTLKCYSTNTVPQVRRELDDDLTHLADLKRLVLQMIYEPGLPMTNIVPESEGPRGSANQES